ncbi:MAG TPA: ABC transporter substrate-binding protein [Beijerinckiaceae bacterium]|nr:ABC transporter substrate-binding protein [Beijerinckiaceae bacterium]
MRFALVTTIVCVLAPAAQAETLKVAIPQKGLWDTSITEFGQKAGIFKKEGLKLDLIYTQGGSTTVQSVLSGSIDIGMQTGLLGLIGAYSKGAPVRVISSAATGAADLYWYAKKGSGIKSLKDANGKTIAYSEVGSSTNLVVLAMLQQSGAKAKPVHTGGIPGTFTQVMSGQVDIGWAVPPFGLKDIKDGKIHIVARGRDVKSLGDETLRVNFASANTLKNKRDALIKFSKGYAESVKWVYSHPEALKWFAEGRKVSLDIAKTVPSQFYPEANEQPYTIRGLPLALKQALDYKFISHAMKPSDLKGMIDILYKKNQ